MTEETITLKQHPLSAAYPRPEEKDRLELIESLKAVGVLNSITLYEGMVLDGWTRYTEASKLGLPCPTKNLPRGINPVLFVRAQNHARRHMTATASALAIVNLVRIYEESIGETANLPSAEAPRLPTNAELADVAGVSERTIRSVKNVVEHGGAALNKALAQGEIRAHEAEQIAKLPKAEQRAALKEREEPRAEVPVKQAPKKSKADVDPINEALMADIEKLEAKYAKLENKNAEQTRLLVEMQGDLESLSRVAEADDKAKAALAEAKRYRDAYRAQEDRFAGLTEEKNQAVRMVKTLRRKIEELERGKK